MNILVAHDGSEHAGKALAQGALMAEKLGAKLFLVSVVPALCLNTEEISPGECDLIANAMTTETGKVMRKVLDDLAGRGVRAELLVQSGRTVDEILDTAEKLGADLLVVGSRGRHGAKRYLMGSVSTQVAEHAKCNVLIVK